MVKYVFTVLSFDEMDQLGALLAKTLPDGAVVGLIGTLGAGKTRLTQAIAAACGVDPTEVTSPTFVLIQEYYGDRNLYHFDLYRLDRDVEFQNLGPDEYFESDGITLLEWADKFEHLLPLERVTIQIDIVSSTARRVTISAVGAKYTAFLDAMRRSGMCDEV